MATIRKRGTSWHVRVRRLGHPTLTRSFTFKADAEAWARQTEVKLEREGISPDVRQLKSLRLRDLVTRYRDTVSCKKKSAPIEAFRIKCVLAHSMSDTPLLRVTPALFASFRDERLQTVVGETARKDLRMLHHIYEVARKEWGLPLFSNPLASVKLPPPSQPRTRRMSAAEFDRLMAALRSKLIRNRYIEPVIRLAIETGMRRGELLAMRWADIDLGRGVLTIPISKNGYSRTIPLTKVALAVLGQVTATEAAEVFPITGMAIKLAWARLTRRAGIPDLHFHDLRHEAISRFFERGLNIPEVALISGHRDVRMLWRYTHPRPEDIARKLNEAAG